MEEYIKAVTLDNEIEAGLLESILKERDIPHLMRSYHDTAYDGLYQTQKGWGVVNAPESYREEIEEILSDLREDAKGRGFLSLQRGIWKWTNDPMD
jgi:cell division GTPase FtsZ